MPALLRQSEGTSQSAAAAAATLVPTVHARWLLEHQAPRLVQEPFQEATQNLKVCFTMACYLELEKTPQN